MKKKPAKKYLYYKLSDNADVSEVVMDLKGCMAWIEGDMEMVTEGDDDREYIISPVWMTQRQFNNLPEADI